MFTASLFTVTKMWKQSNCPFTDDWMKRMWFIYEIEYYSAIRKDEILSFVTTWTDIESIMLSEVIRHKTTRVI